jgi:hypothetical protein
MDRGESPKRDVTDELRRLIETGRWYAETPSGNRLLGTLSSSMVASDASRGWTLLGLDVLLFGDREQANERLGLWGEMLKELARGDPIESLVEVGRLANAVFVTPAWIRARLRGEDPHSSDPATFPARDSALLLILGLLVEIAAVEPDGTEPGAPVEDTGEPLLR